MILRTSDTDPFFGVPIPPFVFFSDFLTRHLYCHADTLYRGSRHVENFQSTLGIIVYTMLLEVIVKSAKQTDSKTPRVDPLLPARAP